MNNRKAKAIITLLGAVLIFAVVGGIYLLNQRKAGSAKITLEPNNRSLEITEGDLTYWKSLRIINPRSAEFKFSGHEKLTVRRNSAIIFTADYDASLGGVQRMEIKSGNKLYNVFKHGPEADQGIGRRQRPRGQEYDAQRQNFLETSLVDGKYLVRDINNKWLTKGEAVKITKPHIEFIEKALQELRTKHSADIKKAEERSKRWYERNRGRGQGSGQRGMGRGRGDSNESINAPDKPGQKREGMMPGGKSGMMKPEAKPPVEKQQKQEPVKK